MKLYLTATGIYAGTQADAKRDGKGWKLEEVPTDKYGLIDYLNRIKHGGFRIGDVAGVEIKDVVLTSEPSVGISVGRPHTTQAEVDAMFAPPARLSELPRDRVCEAIADMTGTDLGMVALEVAARFETLAKA